MGTREPQMLAARELVTVDPDAPVHRQFAIALGLSVTTLVLFVPGAFQHAAAWRVLLAIASGSAVVAWVRVLFDLVGRRARLRRAYVRWLYSLGTQESLVEMTALHRELIRGALHPEEARARLEALVTTAERDGVMASVHRWQSVKETLRLEIDVARDALLVERKRLAYELELPARAKEPVVVVSAVREERPRRLSARSRLLGRTKPEGTAPEKELEWLRERRFPEDEGKVMPRPIVVALSSSTRWVPFAVTEALTKDMLDLFGDESMAFHGGIPGAYGPSDVRDAPGPTGTDARGVRDRAFIGESGCGDRIAVDGRVDRAAFEDALHAVRARRVGVAAARASCGHGVEGEGVVSADTTRCSRGLSRSSAIEHARERR